MRFTSPQTRSVGILSFLALCHLLTAGSASSNEIAEQISITIQFPQKEAEGTLEIRFPNQLLLDQVKRAIPESAPIPDVKLGDQLVYRDVQLKKLKSTLLRPRKLTFDKGVFTLSGAPSISGEIRALYEHVVVTTEVRTLFKIGSREVKQSVPVVHSDWREKDATPFTVNVEIQGKAAVSLNPADELKNLRIRVETNLQIVKVSKIDVQTKDVILQIAKEVFSVTGNAFPNEGIDKSIKQALTQTFEVDPFQGTSDEEWQQLIALRVKDLQVVYTADETAITGKVINK